MPFLENHSHQGAGFSINVINNLNDHSMDLLTSIVRVSLTFRGLTTAAFCFDSTGTVCSKRPPIMPMVVPSSINALLYLGEISPINSAGPNKLCCVTSLNTSLQLNLSVIRVHFGITVIIKLNTVMVSVAPLSSMIPTTLSVLCMTSTTVRSASSSGWAFLESISCRDHYYHPRRLVPPGLT